MNNLPPPKCKQFSNQSEKGKILQNEDSMPVLILLPTYLRLRTVLLFYVSTTTDATCFCTRFFWLGAFAN